MADLDCGRCLMYTCLHVLSDWRSTTRHDMRQVNSCSTDTHTHTHAASISSSSTTITADITLASIMFFNIYLQHWAIG